MSRFYFHVHDGYSSIDRDGTELPDVQAARIEAIRLAGEVIKDDAHRIALGENWRVEVTDDTGLILFQMTFLIVESPTIRHAAQQPRYRN